METLARHYGNQIAQQTEGAALAGWSMGGVIAFEIDLQFVASGETPLPLLLIDSDSPGAIMDDPDPVQSLTREILAASPRGAGSSVSGQALESMDSLLSLLRQQDPMVTRGEAEEIVNVFAWHLQAFQQYVPARTLDAVCIQITAETDPQCWTDWIVGPRCEHTLPCGHYELLVAPYCEETSKIVQRHFARKDVRCAPPEHQ